MRFPRIGHNWRIPTCLCRTGHDDNLAVVAEDMLRAAHRSSTVIALASWGRHCKASLIYKLKRKVEGKVRKPRKIVYCLKENDFRARFLVEGPGYGPTRNGNADVAHL